MSIYKLGIINTKKEVEQAEKQVEESTINEPALIKTSDNRFKFEDGTRKYNSEESAMNALNGFRKFQTKRNESSYLTHRKPYEDYVQVLTEEEKKEYDKNIKSNK